MHLLKEISALENILQSFVIDSVDIHDFSKVIISIYRACRIKYDLSFKYAAISCMTQTANNNSRNC